MYRIDEKRFEQVHGYKLNIENPETFSEKLQWIKLYGEIEKYSKYVDKYTVRNFVEKKIGKKYLVPLYGVYDNVEDIDYESLPESFVMKATHGCNWNIFVKDKSMIDWEATCNKMKRWLNLNFYDLQGEACYKNLKGRVIIEKLLVDPTGDLKDYKFYCFHGTPRYIDCIGNRMNGLRANIYDIDWNKLPLQLACRNFPRRIAKPKHLEDMIKIARKLSSRFPFVRVDFYYPNEQIYFSELTFIPGNGFLRFNPIEYDRIFGSILDLDKYK